MLPKTPNLPTDNLYKFMALSGIVITAICLLVVNFELREIAKLQSEVSGSIQTIEQLKGLLEANENSNLTDNKVKFEISKEIIILNGESLKTSNWAGERLEQLQPTMKILRVISFLSAIISICGFYLWYLKVQKPLDEILKLNLKKARTETHNLPN